jgi:hypothetical protein
MPSGSVGAQCAEHRQGKEACLASGELKPLRGTDLYYPELRASNREAFADGKFRPGSGQPRDIEEEEYSMTSSTAPTRATPAPLSGAST